MADTSYLFGSNPPSSITSTLSDTSSTLPAWLQEYTRGLVGTAAEVAGTEYQPYQAPAGAPTYGEDMGKIAGFNPNQQQSFNQVQANQGAWSPYTSYASQTVPQAVGSYMNPYTSAVTDRIAQLGQRNLTENLLPQVNSTFTGQGQFGSTRNADFTNRALRDANESIMGQQASALQTGFQNAQNTALQDMVRQANLGTQVSGLGYTDASMLGQVGQQQQGQTQANLDVAQKDWQAQNDYQKQNLDWLSQITRGLQAQPTAYGSTAINPTQYNTLSPLAAAWQGFSGSKSLMSPTTATPTQQATR